MESINNRVNKDMSNRLAVAANTIKTEKEQEKLKDEEDFWSKERKRAQADPSNAGYQRAVAAGKAKAKTYVEAALNLEHPSHNAYWSGFRNIYNSDVAAVEKAMIADEARMTDEGPHQYRDDNYERKIQARYKQQPTTTFMEAKIFDNFCSALNAKWKRSGYNGDAKFIDEYCAKYGLQATKTNSELASFLPKE